MLRLAIRRRLRAVTLCAVTLCAVARVYADEQRPQPFQVDPQTVALFHFDAAEGANTANAVEREPHGTLAGAAIWQPIDHPGGNRAFAGGLLLIDENASLTWPDSPLADLPGTYTIEFWIRPAARASGYIVGQTFPRSPAGRRLSHLTYADQGRIVHRNAHGAGDAGVGNSAWVGSLTPVLRIGQWTHVAIVNDVPRGRLQIFVDGDPVATARHEHGTGRDAAPHDPKDLPGDLAVGAGLYENPGKSFIGVIDELRISDVARYPQSRPLALNGKRVLFLDTLYVDESDNLRRVLQRPRKNADNPIFRREKPWEKWVADAGQILYDPQARLYKRWYRSFASISDELYSDRGAQIFRCYGTSKDGLSWERPNLGRVEFQGSRQNNIVETAYHIVPLQHDAGVDKQFAGLAGRGGENLFYSDDGLDWEPHPQNPVTGGTSFGMSGLFFDPLRKRYAAYGQGWLRLPRPGEPSRGSRIVSARFSPDLIDWTEPIPVLVPSVEDPRGFEFYAMSGYMDGDLYIGLPWAYRSSYGPGNDPPHPRQYGPIETELAVSRNGLSWQRVAPRSAFLPTGKAGTWDAGMVFTGAPLRMGDQLYFYYSAWDGPHGLKRRKSAGGLAVLTRDRYLALTPGKSSDTGRLTTVVLQPSRGSLWVNADARRGQITVRLVSPTGETLPGYGSQECTPIKGDSLAHAVRWDDRLQLPENVSFKIEFTLTEAAQLYGFGA